MTPQRAETYLQMLLFLSDVVDFDGYAHACPQDMRERAARILKLNAPELTTAKPSTEPCVPCTSCGMEVCDDLCTADPTGL